MKILITGAAGFIGSRLAKALLDRDGKAGAGNTVIGHDNFDPYYAREHKDRHLRDLLTNPSFQFIEGDLRDSDHVLKVFQEHQPDAVAHMAAMAAVRYSMNHPLIYGQTNVQGEEVQKLDEVANETLIQALGRRGHCAAMARI